MVGRELVVKKDAAVNLREVAARTTLREVRQKGHAYVELRHAGKRIIFFCTICLTPCYSDTVLFDHLKGNLHARRLAAAKVTLFGAIPWPFNDGVLFFDCSHEPNLLLSGSHCQNDMALVVTKNTGTDGEVTSKFRQNSDGSHRALCLNKDCSDDTSRSNVSKSKGSADAKVSLGIGRHKSSTRSSPSILDKISICCWSETSLIIPGVVLKEELANLTVRHLGVGQIAYRMHDNKESPCKITRIWCAWMGQGQSEISDELKTSENCDFAIVNFPYAYGLGRKHALDDEELLVSAGSFFEIVDSGNRRKRKRKSFSDPEDRSESHSGCSGSPSGGSLSLDTAVADDPQQLESQLISSKAVRRELRKQKRLAAERTCDICGQPMLPGKDVATLLNCRTGNLACGSRNTNGAFHPFHASCLIHWILLCELEIFSDQKTKKKTTRGRKGRTPPKNKISSIFCPECQGTGISIQGEELEKPTIPLSEMFLYKLKAIEANKAWMKNPEILQKCSTGLHFPSGSVENPQENVMPLKLLHFFRADG